MMMINRRRACGGKSLPYDAEIEYLESSGTQWIDTGIVPTYDIEVLFKVTAAGNISNFIFGSRDRAAITSLSYAFLVQGNDYFRADWIGRASVSMSTFPLSDEYDILATQTQVTCNGIKKYVEEKKLNGLSLYMFSCNTNGIASAPMIGKFFYCQIKTGNTLVRDFIPVRVGNVGYMYDKVSGQLFGNAGTGSFIIGPDK